MTLKYGSLGCSYTGLKCKTLVKTAILMSGEDREEDRGTQGRQSDRAVSKFTLKKSEIFSLYTM